MRKRWGVRMSRKAWAATIAVALATATLVAGGLVWAAVVNAPPGPFPEYDKLPPPPIDATPPPTVWPEGFWEWPPVSNRGPSTAGSEVPGIGRLPPNIYVWFRPSFVAPVIGYRNRPPGYGLGVVNGKSRIYVSGTSLWDPYIAPGEEGVFDWLYERLGVAKGSEQFSGPLEQAK